MNITEKKYDDIFHALADPTRRQILARIADEEYSVTELAEPFNMSLAAISKHVRVLERAGLLQRTRDGKIHWCGLNTKPFGEAHSLISMFITKDTTF